MANSYTYRYRVNDDDWASFSSWTSPGHSGGLIAQEAAQDYWDKNQPPEADMWPLVFEVEGRGAYEVELRSRPEFWARRPPSSGDHSK